MCYSNRYCYYSESPLMECGERHVFPNGNSPVRPHAKLIQFTQRRIIKAIVLQCKFIKRSCSICAFINHKNHLKSRHISYFSNIILPRGSSDVLVHYNFGLHQQHITSTVHLSKYRLFLISAAYISGSSYSSFSSNKSILKSINTYHH